MTLETIYYVGQTISVVAILGTLIFVGIQVRLGLQQTEQTNKLARLELSQVTGMKTLELQNGWYETEESSDFMARALHTDAPLSLAEKVRFSARMVTLISSLEAVHMLQRESLCDQNLYKRVLLTGEAYCKLPRVQKWWRNVGQHYFLMPFQGVVNEMVKHGETANDAATDVDANTSTADL